MTKKTIFIFLSLLLVGGVIWYTTQDKGSNPPAVEAEKVITEVGQLLRSGEVEKLRDYIVDSEAKFGKFKVLSQEQLTDLADFYSNGVLVGEIGNIREYKSALRQADGSVREVTFRMERNENGRWRLSF
jgi:hypothetical protein